MIPRKTNVHWSHPGLAEAETVVTVSVLSRATAVAGGVGAGPQTTTVKMILMLPRLARWRPHHQRPRSVLRRGCVELKMSGMVCVLARICAVQTSGIAAQVKTTVSRPEFGQATTRGLKIRQESAGLAELVTAYVQLLEAHSFAAVGLDFVVSLPIGFCFIITFMVSSNCITTLSGQGDLYCTGNNQLAQSDVAEGEVKLKSSPVPSDLRAAFGFRCGLTEADARSNCKPECTHHTQCDGDEECWGVQLNYCHTFEEGEHPICTDLDKADNDSRCGVDETSARSHCGAKCTDDSECATGEFCYPVLSNYCTCHEDNDKEAPLVFAKAQALISPYFVESEMGSRFVDGEPEGVPRSSAKALSWTTFGTLLSIGVHFLLF